ncbi:hypothetical protein D3C78_1750240 [compost metagenome]
MVVAFNAGTLNVVPSATAVPPAEVANHWYLSPASGLSTANTAVLPAHKGLAAPETDGGAAGIVPAFTTTIVRVVLAQLPDTAST